MQSNQPPAHGLRPALRTRDVWALGVGIVVCGQYFGWNLGLERAGPVAMLVASLLVCLLFLAWVLLLAELAVAMPSAGGPADFGRRAAGPWMGFVLGWSMLLECVFGAVATALASGQYVAFLLDPQKPSDAVSTAVALGCVVVFLLAQAWGVREQAKALVVMTWAALFGLVVFWVVAATHFSWHRFWTPTLPAGGGWGEIASALPFALWWLIIIEGAALAAEESQRADRAVPRGLTLAVLTVVGLVVLTIVAATGATDAAGLARRDGKEVAFPLAEVVGEVSLGRAPVIFYGFGTIALVGLLASYHGLLYAASRQLFALGRAGYLPGWLGTVHAKRQTPTAALLVCSGVTAGFVVFNLWQADRIKVAVLTAGFAALVLYLGSVVCLLVLRRREPGTFAGFTAPLPRVLPWLVLGLSTLILVFYPRVDPDGEVVPLSLGLYALGIVGFLLTRRPIQEPTSTPRSVPSPATPRRSVSEVLAACALAALFVALIWLTVGDVSSWLMLALLAAALLLLGLVAWRRTR